MLPSIQRFTDFTQENLRLLIDYVHQNPFDDSVYRVENGNVAQIPEGSYLKGSSALLLLMKQLTFELSIKEFVPNDIDIILLNRPWKIVREGKLEYAHLPFESIEQSFLADELPICRVAIDNQGTYWISVQCIVSIYANVCYLPEYVKSREELYKRYREYTSHEVALKYAEKIEHRIKKYSDRGFKFIYKPIEWNLGFIRLSTLSK